MIDILFLICWWTLLLLLPAMSVYYKTFWYSFIIILLIVTGSVVTYGYYRDMYPLGIIRDDIIVRVGPDETYGACGMLKSKDNVVVCDTRGAWKQVQKNNVARWYSTTSIIRGWIPQEYVTTDIP